VILQVGMEFDKIAALLFLVVENWLWPREVGVEKCAMAVAAAADMVIG